VTHVTDSLKWYHFFLTYLIQYSLWSHCILKFNNIKYDAFIYIKISDEINIEVLKVEEALIIRENTCLYFLLTVENLNFFSNFERKVYTSVLKLFDIFLNVLFQCNNHNITLI